MRWSLVVAAGLVLAFCANVAHADLPRSAPPSVQSHFNSNGCLDATNQDVLDYYNSINNVRDSNRVSEKFCQVEQYCEDEYRGGGNQPSPREKSCRERMGGCATSEKDERIQIRDSGFSGDNELNHCFNTDKNTKDQIDAEGNDDKRRCAEGMRYDGSWSADVDDDGGVFPDSADPHAQDGDGGTNKCGDAGNGGFHSGQRKIANCDVDAHGGSLAQCIKDNKAGGILDSVATGLLGQIAAIAQSLGAYALEILIEPENCVTCLIILYFVMTLDTVFDLGFQYLALPALTVGTIAFIIWVYRKLLAPAAGFQQSVGQRAWPEIFAGFAKYLILLVFLGAVSFSAGSPSTSDGPFQWIYGNIIAPSLSAGAGLGSQLNTAIAFGGGSAASRGLYEWMEKEDYRKTVTDAVIVQASKHNLLPPAAIAKLNANPCEGVCLLGRNLISLTASMNLVASMGLARSIGYMGDAGQAENAVGGILSAIIGIMLGMTFIFFMLTAALQLVDPLFRMMIALALSPLLALAFVFNFSKNAAIQGMRTVLYGIAFFMVVGISFAIAIQLITVAFLLDYTGGVKVVSMDDFLARLASGTDSVDDNGQLDIFKPIFSFILAYLAIAVTKFSSKIAGMLTDYQAQGGIAEQVQQQASGFGQSMMSVGMHGASMAASGLGALGRGGIGWLKKLFGG